MGECLVKRSNNGGSSSEVKERKSDSITFTEDHGQLITAMGDTNYATIAYKDAKDCVAGSGKLESFVLIGFDATTYLAGSTELIKFNNMYTLVYTPKENSNELVLQTGYLSGLVPSDTNPTSGHHRINIPASGTTSSDSTTFPIDYNTLGFSKLIVTDVSDAGYTLCVKPDGNYKEGTIKFIQGIMTYSYEPL